jgi:anionic cell wall polymer biosynthesis LytR-Cps2A-Psr (LCP) family protein
MGMVAINNGLWSIPRGGGIALTRRTVSEFLSVPIDYTVIVDFTGFISAIDAIGGVTIDVPVELYDPLYPTMDYRYTVAHFLPGVQHMDGARA